MTAATFSLAIESRVQPVKRFFRTPKGLLLVALALLTALAAPHEGLYLILPEVFGAMLAAALLDVGLARIIRGAWFFPSGALLSGLIVALIVSSTEPFVVAAITAMLAVNSKYLFRARGKHIFNPAALALVAAYFLFASGQSWWGALANVPTPFVVVLLATGIFIADRVNKLPMVLAFLGSYLLLFTLVTFIGDAGRVAEIFRTPDISAALFFAFFMLTDPPTSPARYRDQLMFGAIVAVACCAIYLTIGALYYLPAGLLIGNGWEAWRRTRIRARAKMPASDGTRARVAPSPVADRQHGRPPTDRRVLIVERADQWTRALGPYLSRAGYTVAAASVTTVTEQLRAMTAEAVLVDLTDTSMDGVAACRDIRAVSDVPIIAMTSDRDGVTSLAALDAGADDCQTTPISPDELFARLHAVGRRYPAPGERPARDGRRSAAFAGRLVSSQHASH